MNPEDVEYTIRENTALKQQLRIARQIIAASLPYVESHYERSATGFGKNARELMNRIKEFLGIR